MLSIAPLGALFGTLLAGAATVTVTVTDPAETLPELGAFVTVPAGVFTMGSNAGDADEQPLRKVTIAEPFEMLAHEVTVGAFSKFLDESGYALAAGCRFYTEAGSQPDPHRHARQPGFDQTDRHPAVCVSATDAKAFAAWVTERTGQLHRLPSEAEWEYAAQAAGVSAVPWPPQAEPCRYANVSDLDRAKAHHDGRHYFGNTRMYDTLEEQIAICDDGVVFTAPVASYLPNAAGLYDMIGNAWEWVADCAVGGFGAVPSYETAPTDGSAVQQPGCTRTVIRGGSWHSGPRYNRLSNRSSVPNDYRMYHLGFRLVRALSPPPQP